MKKYEVTWTVRFSQTIEANSAREAVEIAIDQGEEDAAFKASEKRAKLVKYFKV